jgi:hypothetical protein
MRVLFESTYKGGTRTWSTRIYWSVAVNPTDAVWNALANDLDDFVTACITPRTTHKGYTCYDIGSDVPVYSIERNAAGTFDPATPQWNPLEVSILARYTTTQRTSKNHPIYLYQYLRDGMTQAGQPDRELANTDQKENVRQLCAALVDGFVIGGSTYKKASRYGAVAQDVTVEQYLTHRDFPNL